jgi:F0F1-type ATP synthase assembly protein I
MQAPICNVKRSDKEMSSVNQSSDSKTMRSFTITIGVIAAVMVGLIVISSSLAGS